MAEKITCSMVNHGLGITWQGILTPCCQWYPEGNQDLEYRWDQYQGYNDNVRPAILKDFDQGIRHVGCTKCFREEDLGYTSLRQRANELHPETHATPSVDNPIYNFEIRLGNHCNLRCIMCGTYASSAWHQERSQNPEAFDRINMIRQHPQPDKWWENPAYIEFLTEKLKDAVSIDISGGEPFPLPSTWKILDILIASNNTGVRLQFNTNLTRVPPVLVDKLKLFTNVWISVSLEGVGDMNDYLRYPSRWEEISANMILLQEALPGVVKNINHTLQHASVYSLPALVDYAKSREIDLRITTVSGTPCLTMESAPPEDLKRLVAWIETVDWLRRPESIRLGQIYPYNLWGEELYNIITGLGKTTVFDQKLYEDYRQYVKLLDSMRGTDYDAVFKPSAV